MNICRSLLPTSLLALLAGCATAPTGPRPAEAKALGVLGSSQDVHERARACQDLAATTATAAAVPALAALLDDEQLSDYARSALENIPRPEAGKALRDALAKLQGRRLAGVVNSLGVRREKTAVPELRALALDAKRGVASEALASLGMIATPEAAKVLQDTMTKGPADLREPAAHAALVAATQFAKAGNAKAARDILDAVIRAKPAAHIVTAAQNAQAQIAALSPRG